MPNSRNPEPSESVTCTLDSAQRRWTHRAQDRVGAREGKTGRVPLSLTEAEKYRWIRANRSCFEVVDALRNSLDDSDFDGQIESAMRMSVAGPSYFGGLDELPEP
jgi:hypothetical protein